MGASTRQHSKVDEHHQDPRGSGIILKASRKGRVSNVGAGQLKSWGRWNASAARAARLIGAADAASSAEFDEFDR